MFWGTASSSVANFSSIKSPLTTIPDKFIGTTDLKLLRKSNFLLNNQNPPPPSPQTMLMIICTNPCLLLIFFSQHWTGGEGGDVYLGNLVNCDDHVLLYTGAPMHFCQDCLKINK